LEKSYSREAWLSFERDLAVGQVFAAPLLDPRVAIVDPSRPFQQCAVRVL
jgi:hypothetical protein